MKLFYEFRCANNGKCAHTEYLDCLVASLCHVPIDEKRYTVPAGNNVNWLSLMLSILQTMKLETVNSPISMDTFIEAIENDATGETVDFKKPFLEIFKMFKRMNLFLHFKLIGDSEDTAFYKTKEPEKWFTFDDLTHLKWLTEPLGLKYQPAWWPDQCYSYKELMENEKLREQYYIYERGEHILIFHRKGWGEKDMYMVNTAKEKAYHLVDRDGYVRAFTHEDIEPSVFEAEHTNDASVLRVEYAILSISHFKDGKARVGWMLYPDGMYFADEDGYGMEDNDEVNIAAVIDEDCKVIEKFKLVDD